jgi:hypothetical protein
MTNRPTDLRGVGVSVDVRRLMYQPLIWLGEATLGGNQARGLRSTLHAKDLQGLANALIDGVRRNAEMAGNLLRREMLVHKLQAFPLSGGKTCDALGSVICRLIHDGRKSGRGRSHRHLLSASNDRASRYEIVTFPYVNLTILAIPKYIPTKGHNLVDGASVRVWKL